MSADANTEPIPGWLLNEVTSAGRENLDPTHVARYDDKEDADADTEVRFCESLGLNDSSTVVEFGSGTGQSRSLLHHGALELLPLMCRR